MSHIPPIELLEATHQFPGAYTFKVIGANTPEFPPKVFAVFREILELNHDPAHTFRESEGGKHLAITINVRAANAKIIVTLYERLMGVPDLKLLL